MKRPVLLLLLASLPSAAGAAPKTDMVVLRNGDRLTCEIKQLKRGQLQISTDDMGTIYIEWDKVIRLMTPVFQEVQLETGDRYFGPLKPGSADGRLLVESRDGPLDLDLSQVVSLWPVRSRFWKRIDGSLSVGASYTQSNRLLQLSPSFVATYMARGTWLNLSAAATVTRQEDQEDDSERANSTLSYLRTFKERWASFGQVSGQRNTELGLDWRTDVAGGAGRMVVNSNRSTFFVGAGLAATRESPSGAETTTNLEGLLVVQWQLFAYDFPKTNVNFSFMTYPSLTEWGRVWGDAELSLKRELWHDFTLGIEFYDSFDNRPPTEGAAKNDWGATLSLGWTF